MKTSNLWEEIHSQTTWGRWPDVEVVRFIGRNFFHLSKEQRKEIKILDIGVGQGANAWFLIKEGFDVYGVDISSSALDKLKQRLYEEGLMMDNFDQHFKVGNFKSLPFADKMFSAGIDCVAITCVSYTDHDQVFKEINRVFKPSGLFLSLHLLKDSWGYDAKRLIDHDTVSNVSVGPFQDKGITYFAQYDDLVNLLNKNGFSIEEQECQTRSFEKMTATLKFSNLVARKD